MLTIRIAKLSLAIAAALPLVACAGGAGPDADGESLAQTHEAFTGNWTYSWGDTKPSSADIGTSVGRTCFLTGVGGNFRPGGTIWDTDYFDPASAGLEILPNGNYAIYVTPSPGNSIIVQAACVNSAANRVTLPWLSTEAATNLGAYGTDTHRRCFLSAITSFSENSDVTSTWAFTNTKDLVFTFHDETSWYLGGNVATGGLVNAEAVCVDDTTFDGDFTGKLAPNPGSVTMSLTDQGGATCGLTGLQGSLQANFGDWADEVSIVLDIGDNQFSLTSKNGKAGRATCMQ